MFVSFFFIAHVLREPTSPPTTTLHPCRYRPMVSVELLQRELAFSEREDCVKFLEEKGVIFNEEKSKVDGKQSMTAVQSL